MQLRFPPSNASNFQVPEDLFEKGLPIVNPITGKDSSMETILGVKKTTHTTELVEHYSPLWNHFVEAYWPELYNRQVLQRITGNTIDLDNFETADQAETQIHSAFQTMLTKFEGNLSLPIEDSTDSFLKQNFGTDAAYFYDSANGVDIFTPTQRLSAWEQFLRGEELGKRRYNIFLWVWEYLLKIMSSLQTGTINKVQAQQWMNRAQKEAIVVMNGLKDSLKQQADGEDFEAIHNNTVINNDLEVARAERGTVQRRSSEKQQEVGTYQTRFSETNTFVKSLIDQLENALRSVMK